MPAIIGIELIMLALGNNSPEQILHLLSDVLKSPLSWVYISLSMIIGYAGEALRGIRWKLLIQPLGYKVDTIDLINSCCKPNDPAIFWKSGNVSPELGPTPTSELFEK